MKTFIHLLILFFLVQGSAYSQTLTTIATTSVDEAPVRQEYPVTPTTGRGLGYIYKGQNGYLARTLFRFDLSQIPPDAQIVAADLTLYWSKMWGNNWGNYVVAFRKCTEPWSRSTATWDNKPAVTSEDQCFSNNSRYGSFDNITADLTRLVKYWMANPERNRGMMAMLKDETGISSGFVCWLNNALNNANFQPDTTFRPSLVITYRMPVITEATTATEVAEIQAFPNPNSGEFTITGSFEKAEIFNITGVEVLETTERNVRLENPGIYSVVVYTEYGNVVRKVVVDRH